MSALFKSGSRLVGNTPTRRLGLSCKRKSRVLGVDEECSLTHKDVNGDCSEHNVKKLCFSCEKSNVYNVEVGCPKCLSGCKNEDLKHKIQEMKKIILEKEQKLKILKEKSVSMKEIKHLDNLYFIWFNGCKSALLYFLSKLQEGQTESINEKELLKKMGIWSLLVSHFKSDPDLNFLTSNSEDES